MAKSIEILQDTLLKLIVRSGADSDRKNIVLDSGELGYTTDTKRLYVGDGITKGGILAGNTFAGSNTDITTFTTAQLGDLAYDTDNKNLYRLQFSTSDKLSSWQQIGGVYTPANNTISVTSTNTVSVCSISAYNISTNALGKSLTLNSGQVTLSTTIAADRIINNASTFLALPSAIQINTNTYKFPSTALANNTFLRTDSSGVLSWSPISTMLSSASALITVGKGLTAVEDGNPTSSFRLSGTNVNINGIFLPTAHVTFTQAGTIVRNARIASVTPVDFATVLSHVPTIYGYTPQQDKSNLSNSVAGYLIETIDNISTTNPEAVIDVSVKNGGYVNVNTLYINGEGPTLTPYYKVTNTTQILVFAYVSPIDQFGSTGAAIVTSGYKDPSVRFSVTIYN